MQSHYSKFWLKLSVTKNGVLLLTCVYQSRTQNQESGIFEIKKGSKNFMCFFY